MTILLLHHILIMIIRSVIVIVKIINVVEIRVANRFVRWFQNRMHQLCVQFLISHLLVSLLGKGKNNEL